MLLLALAAATATAQAASPPAAPIVEQARASVRIVSGERITAERLPKTALVRDTEIRSADGSQKSARLVEFP